MKFVLFLSKLLFDGFVVIFRCVCFTCIKKSSYASKHIRTDAYTVGKHTIQVTASALD